MKKNSVETTVRKSGSNKVICLKQARWRKTGQILRRKLGEFADRAAYFNEASSAQEIYLSSISPDFGDREDDFTMERCFEWFIFDYVMTSGHTLIEDFKADQTFSDMEKQLLENWSYARISVYEVDTILPGRGMVIKDIIHGDEFTVEDSSVADLVELGTLLLMRVLKVGDEYEFSTSGLALPGFCKASLLSKLQEDFSRYCRRKGVPSRNTWNYYLRDRAHKINGWVMEIGINASTPQPVNKKNILPFARKLLEQKTEEKLTSDITQKISDVYIDEYYDKWLDQRIPVLGNRTPREACRSGEGRKKVEELLREMEQVEQNRIRNGEIHYDLDKIRYKLGMKIGTGEFEWTQPAHGRVAADVVEFLKETGFDRKKIEGAVRLWHDYCLAKNPRLRKEQVWVATVIYAIDRMEFNGTVSQQDLARRFGISASTVSANFRIICDTLELMAYDRRYSTRKSPLEGMAESNPFLAKILENFKL